MLRDVAFLILVFLVIRFVRNLFTPVKVVNNNNFYNQPRPEPQRYSQKEEGKVHIASTPEPKNPSRPHHGDDGEYIDYKEV